MQGLTVFLWLHGQARWRCTSGSSWQSQIWGASYIHVQVSSPRTLGSSRSTSSTSTAWTTWRRTNRTYPISLKCMDWVGPAPVPNVIAHFLYWLTPPVHFLFTCSLKTLFPACFLLHLPLSAVCLCSSLCELSFLSRFFLTSLTVLFSPHDLTVSSSGFNLPQTPPTHTITTCQAHRPSPLIPSFSTR